MSLPSITENKDIRENSHEITLTLMKKKSHLIADFKDLYSLLDDMFKRYKIGDKHWIASEIEEITQWIIEHHLIKIKNSYHLDYDCFFTNFFSLFPSRYAQWLFIEWLVEQAHSFHEDYHQLRLFRNDQQLQTIIDKLFPTSIEKKLLRDHLCYVPRIFNMEPTLSHLLPPSSATLPVAVNRLKNYAAFMQRQAMFILANPPSLTKISELRQVLELVDSSRRFDIICLYPRLIESPQIFSCFVQMVFEDQELSLIDKVKPKIINVCGVRAIYPALAISNKIGFLQQYSHFCQDMEEEVIQNWREELNETNVSLEQLALFDDCFERLERKGFSC